MLLLRWVLLGEGCGCKSVVLRACAIRFLWWIFGSGAGIPGSLCLSPAGGLLEHPTKWPSPLSRVAFLDILFDYYLFTD